MAATHSVQAADMARWFSEIVKDEPAAKQLWFRQIGPISEIWLVADAEDVETERKLRSIGLELYEVFPDQRIDFEVINLALSASDASSYVPKDAESLVLHQSVKPQAENHLLTAEQHFRMATFLAFSPDRPTRSSASEWAITCLFYSAVHYVSAYFLETRGHSHTNHVDRQYEIATTPELRPLMRAYSELQNWSRISRYGALPSLDSRVQAAFDDLNEIAFEIKQLLKVK